MAIRLIRSTICCAGSASSNIRVVFRAPSWQDNFGLSFDEIRQFGASSIEVVWHMRAALIGVTDSIGATNRREVVLLYLDHLNRSVALSAIDDQDKATALQQDRKGLGLPRRKQ